MPYVAHVLPAQIQGLRDLWANSLVGDRSKKDGTFVFEAREDSPAHNREVAIRLMDLHHLSVINPEGYDLTKEWEDLGKDQELGMKFLCYILQRLDPDEDGHFFDYDYIALFTHCVLSMPSNNRKLLPRPLMELFAKYGANIAVVLASERQWKTESVDNIDVLIAEYLQVVSILDMRKMHVGQLTDLLLIHCSNLSSTLLLNEDKAEDSPTYVSRRYLHFIGNAVVACVLMHSWTRTPATAYSTWNNTYRLVEDFWQQVFSFGFAVLYIFEYIYFVIIDLKFGVPLTFLHNL